MQAATSVNILYDQYHFYSCISSLADITKQIVLKSKQIQKVLLK